ncbi:uncharacterized protein STEHIDRAFT_108240 [Stereum hirsutum FP-91666 SS1]|uniref:uncharacterized protein n=1 Tax=Stereum hirsutum (strain FP-91666) TaxID=721885 RepID=UPI000440C7B6|nr:uncharacterized protein STEHIDRAFT_108240 [Stereum hirsutum FP-91666 SS1]EIM89517.1 hypothetical protein STEHIDRAFT_108240 [Stereum hirsutum FP-91666 SS1]
MDVIDRGAVLSGSGHVQRDASQHGDVAILDLFSGIQRARLELRSCGIPVFLHQRPSFVRYTLRTNSTVSAGDPISSIRYNALPVETCSPGNGALERSTEWGFSTSVADFDVHVVRKDLSSLYGQGSKRLQGDTYHNAAQDFRKATRRAVVSSRLRQYIAFIHSRDMGSVNVPAVLPHTSSSAPSENAGRCISPNENEHGNVEGTDSLTYTTAKTMRRASFGSLPLELMLAIFLFAQVDYWPTFAVHWGSQSCCGWLIWRLVCREWRDLMNESGELWCHVVVTSKWEWVHKVLERSGTRPITVRLSASGSPNPSLLRDHRNRIIRLILRDITQETMNEVMNAGFPKLEEIEITGEVWTTDPLVDVEWNGDAFTNESKLRSLSISRVTMSPSRILRFQNLSSLLLGAGDDILSSVDFLMATLPFLPKLRTLELTVQINTSRGIRRVGLDELRRCRVSGTGSSITTFLDLFEMPQVVDVDFDVETRLDLAAEEQFCRAVIPYVRRFDSVAKRMGVTVQKSYGSVVTVQAELGENKLRITIPIPSSSFLSSTTELMKSLGVSGVECLALRSGTTDSGEYVVDEGWGHFFDLTAGLKKLTMSGYGDRWHQLGLLVGGCDTSEDGNLLPWSSLEEVNMRSGFWVKVEVADVWVQGLRNRQERGVGLRSLSISRWEMQASGFYGRAFRDVVQDLEWNVARPGKTEELSCRHADQARLSSDEGYRVEETIWDERAKGFGLAWEGKLKTFVPASTVPFAPLLSDLRTDANLPAELG